jgi:hypothetical protein
MSDKRTNPRSGRITILCAQCRHDPHPKGPCQEPVLPLGERCGCLPKSAR